MSEKKTNILQNPFILSAGISGILSAIASIGSFDADTMKIVNVVIPPLSLALSYMMAWITAKFYTLSIQEQQALSKLKAREKRIRKELKKGGISQTMQKKLEKELDDIVWEKSQIGKENTLIGEVES